MLELLGLSEGTLNLWLSIAWRFLLLSVGGCYLLLWGIMRSAGEASRQEEREDLERARRRDCIDSRID